VRCPRCDDVLQEERYESVQLLACPQGHGALLTEEARRTLTVSARATLEQALETRHEGRLPCPTCRRGSALVVAHRHGDAIELDACAACGAVWFDAGEVARLHHLPPKRAVSAAPRRPPRAMGLAGGSGIETGWIAFEGIGGLVGALLDGW